MHDTDAGEQRKAESERRKRKSHVQVELSNPNKEPAQPEPLASKPGLWDSLRAALAGFRLPRIRRKPRPPRILQQRPLVTPDNPRPEAPQPPRRVEEYYGPKPTPVPPPAPPSPSAQPTASAAPRPGSQAGPPRSKKPSPPPEADRMPGVNLVPEELVTGFGSYRHITTLAAVVLTTVALVGLAYVLLTFFERRIANEAARNQAAIAAIDQQLAVLGEAKAKAIVFHRTTLETLSLINKHIYWTKFFAGLEKYTVDAVYYRGFNADQAGRVTLAATGKDYRSVSRQLIAFTQAKDFVKNVRITSATLRQENEAPLIDFTVTLTLVDTVFFRDAQGGPTYTIEQPL